MSPAVRIVITVAALLVLAVSLWGTGWYWVVAVAALAGGIAIGDALYELHGGDDADPGA